MKKIKAPQNKELRITVRLDEDTARALHALAKNSNVNLSIVIRDLVKSAVKVRK